VSSFVNVVPDYRRKSLAYRNNDSSMCPPKISYFYIKLSISVSRSIGTAMGPLILTNCTFCKVWTNEFHTPTNALLYI